MLWKGVINHTSRLQETQRVFLVLEYSPRISVQGTMAGLNEMECPICFEDFVLPKLLPCGHTFCDNCVKKCSISSEDIISLICPLCRSTTNDVLTNYFIESKCIPKFCEFCHNQLKVSNKQCEECHLFYCLKCSYTHIHQCEENESPKTIPRTSDLIQQFGTVRTKYFCRHWYTFEPEYSTVDGIQHNVYSIRAYDAHAYVIIEGRSYIYKYTRQGNLLNKICTPNIPSGMIKLSDGSLLATFPEEKKLLHYSFGIWHSFLDVSYSPMDVAEIDDDKIVVCGHRNIGSTNGGNNQSHCIVEFLSRQGQLLKTIYQKENQNIIQIATAIAVNQKLGTIAICNGDRVTILFSNGDICSVYKGSFPLRILIFGESPRHEFKPAAICCHGNGHFLVSDYQEGYVHVLDPQGHFKGVLTCSKSTGHGLPGVMSVDDFGFLWVEDIQHKCIKTFTFSFYENYFTRS
ncbi:uncharacterized protein LOC127729320 [Mytilus californianus]|uniref:uncharacterized protein LOC127729320 n=1 Tax=Mytilus californianus TaxID=6549 RepID=UPI00224715F0|nr:uncharacterized protein LOC127729320 [Mytilus californianus]